MPEILEVPEKEDTATHSRFMEILKEIKKKLQHIEENIKLVAA